MFGKRTMNSSSRIANEGDKPRAIPGNSAPRKENDVSAMSSVEPPRWLWLWFPPLLLILEQGAFSQSYYLWDWFHTERGLVEILTPVAAAAGVVAGIAILRHRKRLPTKWLQGWVVLITLGCFYACGEELSWGQHIFGWATPESLAAVNDQGETNLHNISGWFNEAPRTLLWLYVLAGIIHVLLRRGGASWFWPTYVCFPVAILAVVTRAPETLARLGMDSEVLSVIYWSGWSEMEELYLALFLFLYLLSI